MNSIWLNVVVAFVFDALATPVIVYLMQRATGKKLDAFDRKREEREERERQEAERREAEHAIVLAIARTMLLDNFEKCMAKGYYTVEEREVYSKLFSAYKGDGGNGVMDTIAPRMRELPMEPPRNLDGTTLPKGGTL
jgi:hypothetical protein